MGRGDESLAVAAAFLPPFDGFARHRMAKFTPIRRGVGTFEGRGGTIGWLVSDDALVVVDSQFPDSAEQCWTGLQERTSRQIDLLINTHHHGDHTAGNGIFKPHARQILAHKNVPDLQRASAERRGNLDAQVFPTEVYDGTESRTVGDETVTLRHYGPAHTGGDSVIHFEKADVVHMGDLMFHYRPPFIDVAGGASTEGWIGLLEQVHADFTDDTVFIYGHANPNYSITGTRADLMVMRDFLSALAAYVQQGIQAGKSVEELSELQQLPGFPEHFLPDRPTFLGRIIGIVYGEFSGE